MSRVRPSGQAARRKCSDLWDRFSASDPGLIRLTSTLAAVGGVLLTLLVLGLVGTSVLAMVVGAWIAMVAGYAVSDPNPRGQAITLAWALPVSILTVILGTLLAPNRVLADTVFLLLIFIGVYVRRYGPRGNGLGEFTFQIFFVALFARATPAQLPSMCAVVVLALACSGLVQLGLVRATPERTLRRLRRAFRARLGATVDAMIDIADVKPDTPAADRAAAALHRRTARLHQCALMIQSRLETGIEDPGTASLVQRRIAEAEIATEHLAIAWLRALRPHPDNAVTTLALHLPTARRSTRASGAVADRPTLVDPAVARLTGELRDLRLLVSRPISAGHDPGLARVRDRLLGYRHDQRIPENTTAATADVYRAAGELTRALTGLRLILGAARGDGDQRPETARSRVELEAEDHALQTDEAATAEPTGLARPSTRAALQTAAGSAIAILGGELLSPQHWYWALLTCWLVFLNTASVGDILIKSYRRLAGTMAGVVPGIGLAALVAGHTWTAFALTILCLIGAYFTASVSYVLATSFGTAMIGLLYSLLGSYSDGLLVLRIELTAVGAASGLIAALLVLPARTRHRTDQQLAQVLHRMRTVITQSVAQLTGQPHTSPLDAARELDGAIDAFRIMTQPLTHPASPLRERRSRARYILAMLETCSFHARSLAATAELMPANPHTLADPRLAKAGQRLTDNLTTLTEFVQNDSHAQQALQSGPPLTAPIPGGPSRADPGAAVTEQILRHLQRLDETALSLGHPLARLTL
ncbi:FUSC family protein [Rhodococcus sp. NPDC059968]|uniref:FUSC family protein n=1 Tax=Rhodococcus sp. NPDC059968 TaxID=3347017 RepID=UPI00366AF284